MTCVLRGVIRAQVGHGEKSGRKVIQLCAGSPFIYSQTRDFLEMLIQSEDS